MTNAFICSGSAPWEPSPPPNSAEPEGLGWIVGHWREKVDPSIFSQMGDCSLNVI
jgi:hypothetical protein